MHQILHSDIEYETIRAYKIKYNEYAFDIQSPSQFHKANLDGIQGYIADMINFDPSTAGKYRERFIKTNAIHSHYCKDSKLDYESTIGMNCIILEHVEVGPNTALASSVIGRGAKIGQNCQVQGSLFAKLSQVMNNCSIKDSYIGEGCEIGEAAKLSCVYLEAGAKVLPGLKLENVRIGADGTKKPYNGKLQSNKQILEDDSDFMFEEEEEIEAKELDFDQEVDTALRHGVANSYSMKDIIFELNNLKLTMHKSLLQTLVASTNSIYESLAEGLAEAQGAEKLKLIQETHDYWKPLLDKFMDGDENKLEFLKTLLAACERAPQLKFSVLVQVLYKKDIVDDEAILGWYETLPQESPSPFEKAVQDQCRVFVEWLKKNNEEESEGEEESGEEESSGSATSQ